MNDDLFLAKVSRKGLAPEVRVTVVLQSCAWFNIAARD